MAHINSRTLKVGDEVFTYMYGFGTIVEIDSEHVHLHGTVNQDTYQISLNDLNSDGNTIVRSWKDLAKEAIDIQDACNLIALTKSFAKVVREVRYRLESENKGGSDNINTHPIIILYSNKISSLTNSESGLAFSNAYNWAKDIGQVS